MVFAEVYSGSSPLWFFDIFGLLVTFPLYAGHTLFYLNLAMKTKRTTISHLYLWGMLFGLYEGPVTRVLWFGRLTIGGKGGIAIFEFLMLVLFWHPLFSFILPILIFEIFILQGTKQETNIFPSHLPNLEKKNTTRILLLAITIVGATFLSKSFHFTRPLLTCISIGGSLLLILIGNAIATSKEQVSIRQLELSKTGLLLLTGYLILGVYVLMWRITSSLYPAPNLLGILGIAITGILVLLILWKSQPLTEQTPFTSDQDGLSSQRQIEQEQQSVTESSLSSETQSLVLQPKIVYLSWVFFIGLVFVWSLFPGIAQRVAQLLFLSLPLLGILCFATVIKNLVT